MSDKDLIHITTKELVHDYFESHMDIARCQLAFLYPDTAENNHEKIDDRVMGNMSIVSTIAHELQSRGDMSVFDRHKFILGPFSVGGRR